MPRTVELEDTNPATLRRIMPSSAMSSLVRSHNWAKTSLGLLEHWSDTLIAVTNLMLSSPTPTALYLGPDFISLYNDAYRVFLGSKHPDALGLPAARVWNEAWPIMGPQFGACFLFGESVSRDHHLMPLETNGMAEDEYCHYCLTPVHEDGSICGIFITCHSTTSGVMALRALRKSEERTAHVLESVSDAVLVADDHACVTHMNRLAEELTGWTRQEALGRPMQEVFRLADGSPQMSASWLLRPKAAEHQLALVTKTGRVLPIEDGTAEGLAWYGIHDARVVVFRDLAKKRAAEEGRDKYNELKAIYETASVGLAMIDVVNSRCVRVNPKLAEMLETPLEEVTGTSVFDLAREVAGLREALETAARNIPVIGKVVQVLLANHPDVTRYWQMDFIPVSTPDAEMIARVLVVATEITGQRQMQAALIQSEKLAIVGRLADSIAHEINNPLEAVTNLLYLAGFSDDLAEVKSFIQRSETELARVAVITSQTLRFHKQSDKARVVSGEELIAGILSVYHGRMINMQTKLEMRHRAKVPVLCFDGEIRQVCSNLITNALDAMPVRGGRLVVRSRNGTDWRTGREGLILTVADQGGGISRSVLRKMFEPFFTTKEFRGTGLGLWISSEIVHRHNGALRVRSSQRAGRSGTVFSVFLPYEAAARA
jgi:PAS domain S-box-containing protein